MMEENYKYIDANQEDFQIWAYVEIMGHTKVAGRVSTRKFGVDVMLQVDVPKPEDGFSHSELYSPKSIFSIKPTTEEWCRSFVKSRIIYPVLPFIPTIQKQLMADGGEFDELGAL
jgi:hypothetical protein